MKKIYDKVASLQNWRLSVTNSLFKRNSNVSEDDDKTKDDSSDDENQSVNLHGDNCYQSELAFLNDSIEILECRPLPDGESDTRSKQDCCGNIYADLEIDKTDRCSEISNESETYKFLDSSAHLDPECEQRYQNIIDMSEEIEFIKKRDSTRCCSQERSKEGSCVNISDTDVKSTENEKKMSVDNIVLVTRRDASKDRDSESFSDAYSDNFHEGYSKYDKKNDNKPKLVPKQSKKDSSVTNEYDIPKITFSFLDHSIKTGIVENNYEPLSIREPLDPNKISDSETKHTKCKSEIKIVLSPIKGSDTVKGDEPSDKQHHIRKSNTNPDIKNDMPTAKQVRSKSHDNVNKIDKRNHINKTRKSLSDLVTDEQYKSTRRFSDVIDAAVTSQRVHDKLLDYTETRHKRTSKSMTEIFDSHNKLITKQITNDAKSKLRSLDAINKPNISKKRLTSSVDNVLDKSNEDLEYCKVRDKLPVKLRRATLMKRTFIKSRAVDGWSNFRTKVSNIITTQAAAQRVGAQSETAVCLAEEYPKASESVNKLYKRAKKKLSTLSKLNDKLASKKNKIKEHSESDEPTQSEYSCAKSERYCADSSMTNSISECGSVVSSTNKTSTSLIGEDDKYEPDFKTLKATFRKSKFIPSEGQNGFDDLRRYIKQGGDFCKELSAILHERADAELQYSKTLTKLSGKLMRACRDGVGGVNDAWKAVASEMETRADAHRAFSTALSERCVRPLRTLSDAQSRIRKQIETSVDKSTRSLSDWRAAEAKAKKTSHVSARENEKLQDVLLDVRLTRSSSLIHLSHNSHKNTSDKETAKLEIKRRKAEDAMKKADIEYYTLCIRAERARLEWESAVLRGVGTFQSLEDDRLNNLKLFLASFLNLSSDMCPQIIECVESLRAPITQCDATKDLQAFISLQHSSQHIAEQLLPDFYCEHITLAMNRDRRKQALVKLLQLIRQDLDRERKSKHGLENLSRAIKQTPNFGTEDSQQTVNEKLHHMCSVLTYLEGARYKVQSALAEIDNRQRISHPLADHITVTRDKSGLQQSILKVPTWLKSEAIKIKNESCENNLASETEITDWNDRGVGDGNSNQPDSDFDEFSSQSSCSVSTDHGNVNSDNIDLCISEEIQTPTEPLCHCRALYAYTARLGDEISLRPGDILAVYRQQPDGWWLGECNGNVGIFPATYVEIQSS